MIRWFRRLFKTATERYTTYIIMPIGGKFVAEIVSVRGFKEWIASATFPSYAQAEAYCEMHKKRLAKAS